MKSKVYVIQDSPGKNLEPAKEFGEITVMLTGRETSFTESREKLNGFLNNFTEHDFLLIIGSPVNIVQATAILASWYETFNVLVWDREHYKYNKQTILC